MRRASEAASWGLSEVGFTGMVVFSEMHEGIVIRISFVMTIRLRRVFSMVVDPRNFVSKVMAVSCGHSICALTWSSEHDRISLLHVRCSQWYRTFEF